jgi:UDP:flavonoid glycosyltransferase YjiC (YdhE family)
MRILLTTQPALGHFHPMVPLGRALHRLLEEPEFRKVAGGIRAEIESLPGIERGVVLIEELAEARTPRLTSDVGAPTG